MLVDTHCHLTFDDLHSQVDDVLSRAAQAGVERVVTVATDVADARRCLDLMATRATVHLAAGIHPHEAAKTTPEQIAALQDLHRGGWGISDELRRRLVAVGEIGLDFHYDFATPEQQETLFRTQLALAIEVDRPVVIHARKSEERVCEILAEYPQLAGRVVFHCFSGGPELARRVLDSGSFLSFTGVVTFKNADEIRASAKMAPTDRIMVETDAPFLTPVPFRKVRPCEPAHVVHTAGFIADLRGATLAEFAEATTRNAECFFRLHEE